MCFLNCSLFESFRKPEAVLFTLWLPTRVTYWIFNSCNEGNFWKKEEKPFPSKVSKVSQEMIPSNGLSIVGHLIDAGRPIVSSDDVNYCKLDWQQYTRKSFCWITFSTILPPRDETSNMFPEALQFPSTTQTRSLTTWQAQVCELLTGSDIVTVGPTNGLQSTDGRFRRRDFWVTLTSLIDLLPGLVSNTLTHCHTPAQKSWARRVKFTFFCSKKENRRNRQKIVFGNSVYWTSALRQAAH